METDEQAITGGCPVSHAIGSDFASDGKVVEDFGFPSPEVTQCPYPFYAALRREAPIYKYPGRDEFLIARRSEILEVLKRPDIFSNEGWRADARMGRDVTHVLTDLPDMPEGPITTAQAMSQSDPPEHTAKRRPAMLLVRRDRLEAADPVIARIANELI